MGYFIKLMKYNDDVNNSLGTGLVNGNWVIQSKFLDGIRSACIEHTRHS